MAMSAFTAQALMKALGGAPSAPIDKTQPWNPAAMIGQTPGWGGLFGGGSSGGGKGGASQPSANADTTDMADPGPMGNGIARGVGVTQAQVDAANKDNPYHRDAADVEEGIYGKDRANVQAYAGSIGNNQAVPEDIRASIERLRKAGVYSPVDLGGYSG